MTESHPATAKLHSGELQGRWVLDPAASTVEFRVRHFWGAITVRGWFDRLTGEGSVEPGGAISGQLTMDAGSLNTKNSRRDKHLRSADFFDVENHPTVVLRATGEADPEAVGQIAFNGTLEAAGRSEPVSFTAQAEESGDNSVTLRADLVVDRTVFGMTWSPLGMAAQEATGTVVARFVRG
jgi:polyisoprenoid-binding protein YceI